MDRCAYDQCQAEGVILPGAPFKRSAGLFGPELHYHPGCYDAEHGLVIAEKAKA